MGEAISLRAQSLRITARSWDRLRRFALLTPSCGGPSADREEKRGKAVEMALAGDTVALRLCLDRLAPVRKDRPVMFELPPITTTADIVKASGRSPPRRAN